MARVIFSESADTDTDEIFDYLATRGGRSTVRRYQQLFEEAYNRLHAFPRSGHPRPKLGTEARVVIVTPYLINYDWDASTDAVVVLRIVRQQKNLTRRLVRGE